MPKLGKDPARSLESFGVSGLLAEDCKVYYDNLFGTKHAGRVSDLIAARLREAGTDEFKLRALLLYGVFQAYRCQAEPTEPVLLECGIDGERIAVSVAFKTSEELRTEGLAERIVAGEAEKTAPVSPFEELLFGLYRHSDELVIRIQPGAQIEVVSLIGLSAEAEAEGEAEGGKAAPRIVVLGAQEAERETPKAEDYIELGDLDYSSLLNTDATISVAPPPTGEFLAHGATELEDAVRLRAQAAVLEKKYKVGATPPEESPQLFRIKGEKQVDEGPQATVVKGTKLEDLEGRDVVVVGTPAEAEANALPESDPRVQLYLLRIQQMQLRISELERGAAATRAQELGDEAAQESLKGMLKKVWPFNKKASDEEEESSDDETETEAESAPKVARVEEGEAEAVKDATELLTEIEKGELDKTLTKAKAEIGEIKQDVSSQKAKRWMDGLMGELVQEKARLHEMAQKLNASIRQKELEFKTREIKLNEEIRKRDENLRQKTHALNRTKDQLAEMTVQMDKLKSATQEKVEEGHFRQKYQLSQKLLVATKDEVSRLTSKVEDLKGQLASAQLAAKTRGSSSNSMELQTLRTKNERTTRQLDELRNLNEQLTARIQQLADRPDKVAKVAEGESPKKLEASMKQLAAAQKDNEQMRQRIEELSREEARARIELKRSQLEIKNLRMLLAKAGKKAGMGTGGTPTGGTSGSSGSNGGSGTSGAGTGGNKAA